MAQAGQGGAGQRERPGCARAGPPPAYAVAQATRWKNCARLPDLTRPTIDLSDTCGGGGLSSGSLGMSGCSRGARKPSLTAPG
eukprot:1431175-Prymnesium_polylepis.1